MVYSLVRQNTKETFWDVQEDSQKPEDNPDVIGVKQNQKRWRGRASEIPTSQGSKSDEQIAKRIRGGNITIDQINK